ncbi:uncharacterized protein LOC122252999 [Penaeus japonicus]|uniref:uncharacterized protein LOC122252999 n=1 Tax=Penaeus japonicus TaxID=27405 RepID=UPI001C711815|nr:uncharacterized protein LOC122252999 [Penaeus japonicus]
MKARTKTNWEKREVSIVTVALLFQLVPSFAVTHGESCNPTVLQSCSENEMCRVEVENQNGTCQCLPNFTFNAETNKCEEPKPPPDDSPSHLGLSLGLGITFTIILVAVALALAHRRYGILSTLCSRLPRLHLFGKRGEEFVVDSGDDDSPIV